MGIRGLDVWIDKAQARAGQRLGSGARESTEIGSGDSAATGVHVLSQIHDFIVGHVLYDVEGHISKVALVTDAVTGAKRSLAVSENVPSEANAGSKVIPILCPQATDRALMSQGNIAITNALEDRSADSWIEIGVQRRILIMLNSVVFPAESKVDCKALTGLPGVLSIEGEFVVAV